MKTIRISFILALLILLNIPSRLPVAQTEWVNIYGTITYEDTPLCAMVLANGQYMFTCGDNTGIWDLEVPLDSNGEITLYGFCSGFSPFKTVLTPSEALDFDIAMVRAATDSREIDITIQTEPGTDNPNWERIWGTVTHDGQELCAMVLANGQNMFSCGVNLGTFDLEVPLASNGEITLYCFCSGFAPYKYELIADEVNIPDATACENLANLELAYTEVTSAELIPEGPPPFGVADIPGHCRVQLDLRPSADSLNRSPK